jgi:hypothetical protein
MNTSRPLSLFGIVVAMSAVPLSQALITQTALDQVYDKTKQVVVKGMLIGSATTKAPHSVYLLISAQDAKGNVQQWAVEGDPIDELHKHGYKDDKVKMGELITVVGYAARPGKRPEDGMPKPVRGALARAFDLAREGRLIYGTEITVADGTKVPFGRMK